MFALADYLDERWSTYAGQVRLAREADVSERTVRRFMAEAETVGWLCREPQHAGPGDGRGRREDRVFLHVNGDRSLCPCADNLAGESDTSHRPPGVVSPATRGANDEAAPSSRGTQDEPTTSDVPPSDVTSSDAEAARLAELLADLIEQNGSKRPTVTKSWVTEIDRMIRLDSRSVDLVEKCIRWSQADSFWRANIMSPGKLRKHYDRLRLASIAAKQQNGNSRALDPIGDHLALRFDDEGGLIR